MSDEQELSPFLLFVKLPGFCVKTPTWHLLSSQARETKLGKRTVEGKTNIPNKT